jgi:hypothetical protein
MKRSLSGIFLSLFIYTAILANDASSDSNNNASSVEQSAPAEQNAPAAKQQNNAPSVAPKAPVNDPDESLGEDNTPVSDQNSSDMIQDAVLEGIQIASEDGKIAGEKIVTCYFIFKDKPSSYFYEVKKKSKKMIFEFNDTKKGTSPIASIKEAPIDGFTIEEKKVDVNKEVKGLKQEWHDLVSVSFDMRKLPPIDVKDEYNVISYTYKWTTDPLREDQYAIKDEGKKNLVIWGSIGGIGLIGGGILVYKATSGSSKQTDGPLDISNLPYHP